MIAIVDAGMGNVGAVQNMLRRIGAPAEIVQDPDRLSSFSKLVLPGVGAFDRGRTLLDHKGFTPVLHELVLQRRLPVLGICLGMQLMTTRSDEGDLPGLGWIDGETVRFEAQAIEAGRLKIPHMGWDEVRVANPGLLFEGWEGPARFYFVHSFRVVCRDPGDVTAFGHHGHDFVAAFQRENIFGVQFHPEKSHRFGFELLRRFSAVRS